MTVRFRHKTPGRLVAHNNSWRQVLKTGLIPDAKQFILFHYIVYYCITMFWNKKKDKADPNLAKIGDTVMYLQCNGCMGENHEFVWIGKVTEIKKYTSQNMLPYHEVVCEILKEGHRDWRDYPMGYKSFCLEDGSAQRLSDNLIVLFK